GFPPTEVLAERPIDLAVICAATSSNVSNTPDSLLTVLKPSQVILAHWEDFFRSQTLPIQLSPATDLDAIRESLRKSLPRASGSDIKFRKWPISRSCTCGRRHMRFR